MLGEQGPQKMEQAEKVVAPEGQEGDWNKSQELRESMEMEHEELVLGNAEDSESFAGCRGFSNCFVSGPGKTAVNSGITNYITLNVIIWLPNFLLILYLSIFQISENLKE